MPTIAKGWGTDAADQPLREMEFKRRDLRPNDVAIKITHAGICHSDLHVCRNDWGGSQFPVVPGHEIVGTVVGRGSAVPCPGGSGCYVRSRRRASQRARGHRHDRPQPS